ncbi:MAG: 2-succinyl-5-enolpyruvyl-6-hydroxy-3-cyclohexene-1-carboxylic-acid synthase [Actinomycetota bacterium]
MKAQNAGQAEALVMVDEFVRCGLTDACLAPGSRSTPMALALAEHPGVRLRVLIDERSAGFVALGIAKESRRPVAILTTSGTATANLFPAIIEASYSKASLLVLTADRPPELRDTGAGQTIDQIKLYGQFIRWFAEVGVAEARPGSVEYWRSVACNAFAACLHSPKGPVHLNLAFRDPLVPRPTEGGFPFPLDGRAGDAPWREPSRVAAAAAPEELDRLAGEIGNAKRGLIVVGTTETAGPAAHALCEHLGWPVIAEATSGARRGDAISAYDAILRDSGFSSEHRPDFVLRIGSLGISAALMEFLDAAITQVSIDDGPFASDPRRASGRFLQAEPTGVCEQLRTLASGHADWDWLSHWLRAGEAARRTIDEFLDMQTKLTEPAIARDLAALLPDDAHLFVSSSMPIRDLDWFMHPRQGLKISANRGVNGIDGFVSTALGVALSSGGPAVALCGDLSFLHDQNGLLFARNNPVDLTFVVINNNGGGIFSFLPQADDDQNFERLFGTPHNIDLARLCDVYGLGHALVQEPAHLPSAMAAAQKAGGVQVIEARTDRHKNTGIHRKIWALVGEAI